MSMNDPAAIQRKTDARLRILFILWGAQLTSLLIFALLAVFVLHPNKDENPSLFWALMALGVTLVAVSFLVKQKFLAQASEQQSDVQSAARTQSGYIVAWALSEAAGLFGVLARAITDSSYYYLLFIIAALGMLLHIPRRDHIAAAFFKNGI
jgi:uncharacterized membrane protein YeiB